MLQNRSSMVVFLLLGFITILNILNSLLSNIAASVLPVDWKPYLWLSWPLLIICYIAAIVFNKWLRSLMQNNEAATPSTQSPAQKSQVLSANQQSTTKLSFRQTAQFRSTSSLSSRPTEPPKQELPPIIDDDDDDVHHLVDDPLPQKPQGVAEPSAREFIAKLPVMEFEELLKFTLPEGATMVYWSPDGTMLACTFPEHEPILLTERDSVTLPSEWGLVQALCWSPDGRILAVSTQGTIHFWDVMSRKESGQLLHLGTKPVYGLDWSIRGQLAIWADSHIQLFTWQDFSSPQMLPVQQMQCDKFGLLRWSPDGSLLVMGATSNGGKLLCWNIDTKSQQVLQSNARPLTLEWLPKSSLLIAIFSDKRTMVWNADNNQIIHPWEKLPASPRTLSISPDHCIVVASNEHELLFGRLDESFPSSKYKGQLLARWSPVDTKLALLDEQKETLLVVLSSRSNRH